MRDSETDILSSLEISEPPALVVIVPEGETVKYEGQPFCCSPLHKHIYNKDMASHYGCIKA